MKLTEKAEKLLNQYLLELEKHLPLFKARDIIRERESDFLDMLEDSAQPDQSEISEEQVKALLNKTGSPELVARQYQSRQYFIGPELYPLFSLVVKIVGAVLVSMALIGGLVFPETMAPQGLGPYALSMLSAIIHAFGWICVVFFILGFFRVKMGHQETWDVSHLSAMDQDEYPGTIWLIIFMGILLASALLLNFFNNRFPLIYATGSETHWSHFALVGFEAILPWFTLFLGLRFIHTGALVFFKNWTHPLHISDIVLKLLGAFFPLWLFLNGFKLQIIPGNLSPEEAMISVLDVFTQLGRVGMLVIAGAMVFSAGVKVFKMATKKKTIA